MFKVAKFSVLSAVALALEISDEEREMICDSAKYPFPPHRQAAIRWLHVPKTRAKFANTIWNYGCNIAPTASFADIDNGYDYHLNAAYPIKDWCPKLVDHTPGTHKPIGETEWACHKGHFVAMMREPSSRLMQAYHQDQCISDCNPENSRTHAGCNLVRDPDRSRSATCNGLHGSHCPTDYAAELAAQGCQTKMLLGWPCSTTKRLTKKEVDEAVDRVRSGFAFIGLVEEWDLSLCMFHRILGGNFYTWDASKNDIPKYFAIPHDCPDKKSKNVTDEADGPVYDAAKEFFESKVYQVLREIRGETDHHAFEKSDGPDSESSSPACGTYSISKHA